MAVIEVTEKTFENEVINSDIPVLADFYADWCGPCKMLRPSVEELSEEMQNVKFVSINIDDNDELAYKYGISSIPCLVLFKNGEEVDRSIGLRPKQAIKDFIGE